MKFFALSAPLEISGMAATASVASRQSSCTSGDQFGSATVTSTTGLHIGDTITITVYLTCALQAGISAKSIDYNIFVPPSQIVPFGSHVVAPGALSDSLTTTIPNANFVSGQTYDLFFDNNFDVGSKGGQLISITFS